MPEIKNKLKNVKKNVQVVVDETNIKIEELGERSSKIHHVLSELQTCFDLIRHVPSGNYEQLEKLKGVNSNWRQQVVKIEKDYKLATIKSTSGVAGGVSAGVATATLGPTAAMGVATTFGVASTGTAISSLSGVAATNAALAWLGGGTLAAGGSGVAGGSALLTLAGPVGWAIAGATFVGSGFFFLLAKRDKEKLGDIFIGIGDRDVKSYKLAIVELNERIKRIDDESEKIQEAIKRVKSFGLDYTGMSEEQQYELGAYLNLMHSSTQLLVNPILGLQPKYSTEDYELYLESSECIIKNEEESSIKELIIFLANLLYKIEINDRDKKLLWKSMRKNKEFLSIRDITKKEFDFEIMKKVNSVLEYKYR